MGLFGNYSNRTYELTAKQIYLEYGHLLIEGEAVEKAIKFEKEKLIFTSYRMLIVSINKNHNLECHTFPYKSISKFSKISNSKTQAGNGLLIWCYGDEKPLFKALGKCEVIDDIFIILSTHVLDVAPVSLKFPAHKLS